MGGISTPVDPTRLGSPGNRGWHSESYVGHGFVVMTQVRAMKMTRNEGVKDGRVKEKEDNAKGSLKVEAAATAKDGGGDGGGRRVTA